MRRHLTNATYGVVDYASYPLGMLLVAPIVLHKLGAAEYGVWMIATAVISTGGIIASGFCDANMQRVAHLRGTGETSSMAHAVRSMLGINLSIGLALAIGVWLAAPLAAPHIARSHVTELRESLICLRIASVLILVRAIESVSVSTQRAFEEYRDTVRISTAVRLLTLGTAAILALSGWRTVSILTETAVFLVIGTYFQFRQLRKYFGTARMWPSFHRRETRILLGFGVFSWLQAFGNVIFSQLDRVFLGVALGAAAVAPYALCVQFSQPIVGVTASGLQFVFPYLSGRAGSASSSELTSIVLKTFACNLALVSFGAVMLLLFGDRIIQAWAGTAVARSAAPILPPIVLGAFLTGLSVSGIYVMLALGQFRTVAGIGLSVRAAMWMLMIYLLRREGLFGLAMSRVCDGLFGLLLYWPLIRCLSLKRTMQRHSSPMVIANGFQKESAQ